MQLYELTIDHLDLRSVTEFSNLRNRPSRRLCESLGWYDDFMKSYYKIAGGTNFGSNASWNDYSVKFILYRVSSSLQESAPPPASSSDFKSFIT